MVERAVAVTSPVSSATVTQPMTVPIASVIAIALVVPPEGEVGTAILRPQPPPPPRSLFSQHCALLV